jgi:hypothetical protein
MSQPSTRDDPRDAHLLAALRHAPDRGVEPPAQVSAAILGHARRAVRVPQPRPQGWLGALRAALGGLWQPLPMAAFGTLAMATLIGVMWGGQDVPDATPSLRPAPAVAAPPPASAVGSLAAAPPLPESVRADAKVAAPLPASKATAAARSVAAPKAADAGAQRDAAQESRVQPETTGTVAGAATPRAAAPAPATPASAPTVVAEAPPQRDALGKSLGDAIPASARARSEAAAAAIGATATANANDRAGALPLASVSVEIDAVANSEPARVRWRVAAQRLVAHDTAQRDWWTTLARATQGRWQPAAMGLATGTEGPPLTLLIDGTTRGHISFEPQAVVWRDANGTAWRAPIAAEALRAWQEALARW